MGATGGAVRNLAGGTEGSQEHEASVAGQAGCGGGCGAGAARRDANGGSGGAVVGSVLTGAAADARLAEATFGKTAGWTGSTVCGGSVAGGTARVADDAANSIPVLVGLTANAFVVAHLCVNDSGEGAYPDIREVVLGRAVGAAAARAVGSGEAQV